MNERTDHMQGWRYCSRSGSVIKTDTDGDDLVIFKSRSDHRSYQYSVLPKSKEAQAMRLAAAAPDLLEALQDLLEACIREYGQPDDGEPDESVGWIKDRETGSSQPMPFTYGLMQRSRAALSKALPAPPAPTKGA